MSDQSVVTSHHIRAAVEVARIIDHAGNNTQDARDSYSYILSQGEHRSQSLRAGEALLVRLGLLVETDGRLYPTEALTAIARLEPQVAENVVQHKASKRDDDAFREFVGAAGELEVLRTCIENLTALGRADLAEHVRQVSLVDDSLGYDISAPSLMVEPRMLEVKTSANSLSGVFDFYISRNEYDTGRRNPNQWSLVACFWDSETSSATVVGWCRASTLTAYVPTDGAGRWTEARVRAPKALLFDGIPPPI